MQPALSATDLVVEGGVAYATLHHPPINLVGPELTGDLVRIIEFIDGDPTVRVLVLQSRDPDYFLAHVDVIALAASTQPEAVGSERQPRLSDALIGLSRSSTVSIAKISGRARGVGSEVALACDLRFASRERAVISQPEVGVGLTPGAGGTQRLPALLGRGRALEAILGANDFDAELAERYGWINRALPDDQLDAFVDHLARRIAGFPPAAIATAKALINDATLPADQDLGREARAFAERMQSPEATDRLRQLLERGAQTRSPVERHLGDALTELT